MPSLPITEVQSAYRRFRKQYANLLKAARHEMATPLQRALVDQVAATAFSAGYNAPTKPAKPVTLKGWKAHQQQKVKP